MAIELSTAGIKIGYAVETTAGTRPTSGYTRIYGIKSTPSLNPAPDTLETTTLDELEYKTYVDGLKDLGGALTFTANFTQELYDLYNGIDGIMATWKTAKEEGRRMYLCIDIAGLSESCYLSVTPSKLGMPAASVNSVMEVSLYFTPAGEPEWATDPTYAE